MRIIIGLVFGIMLISVGIFFYGDPATVPSPPSVSDIPLKTFVTEQAPHLPPTSHTAPDSSASAPVKPAQVCYENVDESKLTRSWVKQTYGEISQHLTFLQSKFDDETIIDHISTKAGFSVTDARTMRNGYTLPITQPLYTQTEVSSAGQKQWFRKTRRIRNKEFGLLLTDLNQKILPGDKWYWSQNRAVFIYQWVMGASLNNEQKHGLLRGMLKLDIPVYASDLAAATAANIPVDIVQSMYQASDVDAVQRLHHGPDHRSFTLGAMVAQNVPLTEFWLEQGSSAHPDPYKGNGLDILARFNDQLSQQQINRLYQLISPEVDGVVHFANLSRLAKLVSPEVLQQHPLSHRPLPPSPELDLSSFIFQLQQMIIQSILFLPVTELSPECQNQLAHQFSGYIFKHTQAMKKQQDEDINRSVKEQIKQQKQHKDALIAEAEGLFSAQENIEKHLAPNSSLESKELLAYYRHKLLEQEIAAQQEQTQATSPDNNQSFNELYELAKQGSWQQVMEKLSTIEPSRRQEIATSMLFIPVFHNFEPWAVRGLFDAGATLPGEFMALLLMTNKVPLAKLLLPYGLDIHSPTSRGQTPVSQAASTGEVEMLHWLIKEGSSVLPQTNGFDALDRALRSQSPQQDKLTMIRLLLDQGIHIVDSHRQIVASFKPYRQQEYQAIIEQFPQLMPL